MANAVLAYVDPNPIESRVREFKMLAEVAGFTVRDIVIQRRVPDSRFYVGSGKLNEVKGSLKDVDYFITYHQLKPSQYYNISRELKVKVMDRVELILRIFDQRAGDAEAKLQIRLAELKHMLPLVKEYVRLSKRGEQIGFHGLGEYEAETYYKHILRQISSIRRRLNSIKSMRDRHILKRRNVGIPEVALTGYTMAGKTTLFNRLARESKYIDGRAFATLSTYSRLIRLNGLSFVLTDTVGFIDDLPPLLVESFYSTIRELIYADLVILMIDASDPVDEVRRKLSSSLNILREVGVPQSKVLPVLNKIDVANNLGEVSEVVEGFGLGRPVAISAKEGLGIDELLKAIRDHILEAQAAGQSKVLDEAIDRPGKALQ